MPKQQMITASRGSLSYCGTPERKMFGSTSVLRTGQGDHVFVMTQLLLHSYPHTHTHALELHDGQQSNTNGQV